MLKLNSIALVTLLFLTNIILVSGSSDQSMDIPRLSFAGGDGSSSSPFQISNVTQLQNISANLTAHYVLINDIDASETSGWNGGKGFEPIAYDTDPGSYSHQGPNFTGSLDGQGYNITNLTIDRETEQFVGLIGYMQAGSIIGTSLIDSFVTGTSYVGGFVGYNSGGNIANCSSNGTVSGYDNGVNWDSINIAGIVGYSTGSEIRNCTVSGDVDYGWYIGGIVGTNRGIVSECTMSGNTTGKTFVGGIIGTTSSSTVTDCVSTGNITGYRTVGGLIGSNGGTIFNCYTTGNVTGTQEIGGLVGNDHGLLSYCYNTGDVDGDHQIGGLVGNIFTGTVHECLSTGQVTGRIEVGGVAGKNDRGLISNSTTSSSVYGQTDIGGLVGTMGTTARVDNSFYSIADNDVNGVNYVTPFGLYPSQYDDWVNNGKDLDINDHLSLYSGINNYEIASVADLVSMLGFANLEGYNYTLTSDLDLALEPGLYIPFLSGDLDGNGHTISNVDLTYFENSNLGLIGISKKAILQLEVLNSIVSGHDFIGGLVGTNWGDVTNCSVTGTINGTVAIGGLAGKDGDHVTNCSFHGNVKGRNFVGGLVGIDSGTILDSNSSGNVLGSGWEVGGLVGCNDDLPITNCFSTSNIQGMGDNIGGLVGYNNYAVTDCNATGDVDATGDGVGGLLGYHLKGRITNCYATGNVTGNDEVGGLGGHCREIVDACYATGNVSGNNVVGGLIGYNRADVQDCYTSGNVVGNNDVGGLLGWNVKTMRYCYSKGSVNGSGDRVGGAVGSNNNTPVENCYATGDVQGNNTVGSFVGLNDIEGDIIFSYGTGLISANSEGGGFCGKNNGTVYECFWDMDTTGSSISSGGFGRTTAQMKQSNVFIVAGWNLPGIWDLIDGVTYPYLYPFDSTELIQTSDVPRATEEEYYQVNYSSRQIPAYLPGYNDPDISWSMSTNTGEWLTFTDQNVLQGTPQNSDVGNYWVDISLIADENVIIDSTNFTLSVRNSNDLPSINTTAPLTATEDVLYSYDVNALDEDLENAAMETLTFSLDLSPSGMSIDAVTGLIGWTPTNAQAYQDHDVIVNVTDIAGADTFQTFTINVTNTNDAPLITSQEIITATEDTVYTYEVSARDPDLLNPSVEALTFSLDVHPEGMTIEGSTITWTPTNDHVFSTNHVKVNVSDLAGAFDVQEFEVSVTNVNDPPYVVEALSNITTNEDTPYLGRSLASVFNDMDGDLLTYRVEGANNVSVMIEPNATFKVVPYTNWFGTETVSVIARDGVAEVATDLQITVIPVNDAPINNNFSFTTSGAEPNDVSLHANPATDVDDTNLTYTWDLGDGTTVNGIDVQHSYEKRNISTTYVVTLVVSDPYTGSLVCTRTITIGASIPPKQEADPVEDDNSLWMILLVVFFVIIVGVAIATIFVYQLVVKKKPTIDEEAEEEEPEEEDVEEEPEEDLEPPVDDTSYEDIYGETDEALSEEIDQDDNFDEEGPEEDPFDDEDDLFDDEDDFFDDEDDFFDDEDDLFDDDEDLEMDNFEEPEDLPGEE